MIRLSVLANVLGRASAVVSVLVFTPLYVRVLGIEAYGLVGLYASMLAVLSFADMGFTATLNRELARLSARAAASAEMRNLLRTFEVTYAGISLVLAIGAWVSAPVVVSHWLQAQRLPASELTSAVRLMGLAIALQLPAGLYIGGMQGLQQQVRANMLQICWVLLQGISTLLVLRHGAPTIVAFSWTQVATNALYCLVARWSLWHALPQAETRPQVRRAVLRATRAYAAGMVGITAISTILTQADKLAVSRLMPLSSLGYYALASTLASAPLMMAAPIAAAVFPRLTGYVALENREGLIALYHKANAFAATIVIPGTLTLAFFATDFAWAWTGSWENARVVASVAPLLLIGQLAQAITVLPFYLALAHGDVRLNLHVGIASMAVLGPLLMLLIPRFGIVGAGSAWLIFSICVVPPYMYFLHRKFVPGEARRWLIESVMYPVFVSVPVLVLARVAFVPTQSRVATLAELAFVGGVTAALLAAATPTVRGAILTRSGGPDALGDMLSVRAVRPQAPGCD